MMKSSKNFFIIMVIIAMLLIIVPVAVLFYSLTTEEFGEKFKSALLAMDNENMSVEFTIPKPEEYRDSSDGSRVHKKPKTNRKGGQYDLRFALVNLGIYDKNLSRVYLSAENTGEHTVFIYSYGLKPFNYTTELNPATAVNYTRVKNYTTATTATTLNYSEILNHAPALNCTNASNCTTLLNCTTAPNCTTLLNYTTVSNNTTVLKYSEKYIEFNLDNHEFMHETGIYLYPWSGSVTLGYLSLNTSEITDISDTAYYKLCVGIMTWFEDNESEGWSDIGEVCLKTMNISISRNIEEYKKIPVDRNDYYMNSRVNGFITPINPEVRSVVGEIAQEHPGEYNVIQICALYDWMEYNINYINDPRGSDYWTLPEETLNSRAGDCEDQSFLLASLIESIGGTSKIYLTDDHTFTAFYAGNNETTRRLKETMRKYYDTPYIASIPDEYGNWILLDPTCGYYAGDLPCSAIAIEGEVYFANQTELIEVYVTMR